MFDFLDEILGRRPMNAETLLGSILELSAAMSFWREPNRIGPGTRNWHKPRGKWSGADIRAMNARNGVGSPKLRAIHAMER